MITAAEILTASRPYRYLTEARYPTQSREKPRKPQPCPTPGCENARFYNSKKGYLQAYCQDCKQARDKAYRERQARK
jgi:hypothetical protein